MKLKILAHLIISFLINFGLNIKSLWYKTTKKEFLANYFKIFTPEYKRELLEQNPFELFRNKNGCMAGNDGQLWFRPNGKIFIIFELNYY